MTVEGTIDGRTSPGAADHPDAPPGAGPGLTWQARNVRRWVAGTRPVARPAAVLVTAQPGAGKGAVVEEVCHRFADHRQCVVVDAMELLYLHPEYAPLADKEPSAALRLVPEAEALADQLLEAAMAGGRNVVAEHRPLSVETLPALAARLSAAGYHVTVLALAVAGDVSLASLRAREETHAADFGAARITLPADHDAALRNLPAAVAAVAEGCHADVIGVLTRTGDELAIQSKAAGFDSPALRSALGEPAEGRPAQAKTPDPVPPQLDTPPHGGSGGGAGAKVIKSGERTIKLAGFGKSAPPARAPGDAAPGGAQPPAAPQAIPSARDAAPAEDRPRGFKLGSFAKPAASPAPPAAAPAPAPSVVAPSPDSARRGAATDARRVELEGDGAAVVVGRRGGVPEGIPEQRTSPPQQPSRAPPSAPAVPPLDGKGGRVADVGPVVSPAPSGKAAAGAAVDVRAVERRRALQAKLRRRAGREGGGGGADET